MPIYPPWARRDRPPTVLHPARENETLERVVAGSILIQAALCGLTLCLVISGTRFTGLGVSLAVTGLVVALATVAWLAQEIPIRALRRLHLLRRVDQRMLARLAGPRREAAQAAVSVEQRRASQRTPARTCTVPTKPCKIAPSLAPWDESTTVMHARDVQLAVDQKHTAYDLVCREDFRSKTCASAEAIV